MIDIVICNAPSDQQVKEAICIIDEAQDAEYVISGIKYNTHHLTITDIMLRIRDGGFILLGYADGEIIATTTVSYEQITKWYWNGMAYTIHYVAVKPGYQGKGIASWMLKTVINKADRIPAFLSTDERNTHAVHLYEKNGFVRMDVSRGTKAKSNAVIMGFWASGYPFSNDRIKMHLYKSKIKCIIKAILRV